MAVTAAVSPGSLPQSSMGRFKCGVRFNVESGAEEVETRLSAATLTTVTARKDFA